MKYGQPDYKNMISNNQLKHDLLLTEFVWTHNNPRRTRYEQNTFRYSLSEGGFYKILPAINEPKKWR